MRTLDTLIQQALMMQELDHAANGNVLVKGWYTDLLPDEKLLFDQWLAGIANITGKILGNFSETLTEIGQNTVESLSKGLTPSR